MASVYDLKPAFQRVLRPISRRLAAAGVSANHVTLAGVLLSVAAGLAASWIDRRLRRRLSLRARLALLRGFWVLFYAAYFAALSD